MTELLFIILMEREIHETCAAADNIIEKMKHILEPQTIPEKHRLELYSFLKKRFERLIFRQVWRVNTDDANLQKVSYFFPETGAKISELVYQPREYAHKCRSFNNQEYEQYLEFSYDRFSALTLKRKMRDNDIYDGQPIRCYSSGRAQLDIVGGSFTFSKTSFSKGLEKHTGSQSRINVPPRKNDLICMEVEKTKSGSLIAKNWFICSDQFLRLWTCIMCETHTSFGPHKGDRLKQRLFSGNRLNTNSHLKWTLAHLQSDVPIDLLESRKRYFHLRTEYPAERWVHVYAALALMARYGELPLQKNIPNNRDSGPHLTFWNLPIGFIPTILGRRTTYRLSDATKIGIENISCDPYFLKSEKNMNFDMTFSNFPVLCKKTIKI